MHMWPCHCQLNHISYLGSADEQTMYILVDLIGHMISIIEISDMDLLKCYIYNLMVAAAKPTAGFMGI